MALYHVRHCTDTNANSDANSDADTNTDTDANTDANTDADTSADTNTNANTDADTSAVIGHGSRALSWSGYRPRRQLDPGLRLDRRRRPSHEST